MIVYTWGVMRTFGVCDEKYFSITETGTDSD